MSTEAAPTIIEFLLARIAEDEREAKICLAQYQRGEGGSTPRWTRQLAECAAKRAIIAQHRHDPDPQGEMGGDVCTMCVDSGPEAQGWPCMTLLPLASIYSDHPDYQQDWAA